MHCLGVLINGDCIPGYACSGPRNAGTVNNLRSPLFLQQCSFQLLIRDQAPFYHKGVIHLHRRTGRSVTHCAIFGGRLHDHDHLRAEFLLRPTGGLNMRQSPLAHGIIHIQRNHIFFHRGLLPHIRYRLRSPGYVPFLVTGQHVGAVMSSSYSFFRSNNRSGISGSLRK